MSTLKTVSVIHPSGSTTNITNDSSGNVAVGGTLTVPAGTVSLPAITTTGDTNTGMFFPAADTIAFAEGGVEVMRIDYSGNVGIGISSPAAKLDVVGASGLTSFTGTSFLGLQLRGAASTNDYSGIGFSTTNQSAPTAKIAAYFSGGGSYLQFGTSNSYVSGVTNTAMTIDPSGNLLVGKSSTGYGTAGVQLEALGAAGVTRASEVPLVVNRLTNDGTLVSLRQDTTEEGTISVSGTTVSYNGGHLARWSQLLTDQRDPALLKGTVLSNLDEMCVWLDAEGNPLANEQLNKMKVSDVEGDVNVAGVFVNWDNDDQTYTCDMNVAMTGDMIIRIAQGVVVQKGDLLMSAGNGTAKPQGDDIVRGKTIAKVTSNHVTCTYADGSYCVPCVLMAC